jgi:hypothetical protein
MKVAGMVKYHGDCGVGMAGKGRTAAVIPREPRLVAREAPAILALRLATRGAGAGVFTFYVERAIDALAGLDALPRARSRAHWATVTVQYDAYESPRACQPSSLLSSRPNMYFCAVSFAGRTRAHFFFFGMHPLCPRVPPSGTGVASRKATPEALDPLACELHEVTGSFMAAGAPADPGGREGKRVSQLGGGLVRFSMGRLAAGVRQTLQVTFALSDCEVQLLNASLTLAPVPSETT